jgi:hypothetical protein
MRFDVRRPALTIACAAALGAMTSTALAVDDEAKARGLALVKAAAEAMGGLDRLSAVKDVTVKGNVMLTGPMGEMKGSSVAQVRYPNMIKSTITLPMGELVQAYDGRTAWVQMGGQVQEMPAAMHAEMERSIQTSGSIGLMRMAIDGTAEVEALEPAEVDGRRADVVRWTLAGRELRIFLDAETHLVSKLAFHAVSPQGEVNTDVIVGDYREASGVKIPWKVTGYQNGQKYLELDATEVTLNAGLDASLFTKP